MTSSMMESMHSAERSENISDLKPKENASSGGLHSTSESHAVMNGYSNGYSEKHAKKEHKSEHRDKHREKDKHRDKHKGDTKESSSKDKEKYKEKHSSSSSSSKDKEREKEKHSSSSKDKEKDREKKHRDDKEKKSSSSSHDKDKEHRSSSSGGGSSSKDKEHKSSSSSKDKEKSHSSSSSSKEKSDKERSDKEKSDKEKHREKDKHSSSKEKHSSSSSSKDKERHKDPDRKHSSGDKHRDKDKEKSKEKNRDDKNYQREKEKEKKKDPVDGPVKVKEEVKPSVIPKEETPERKGTIEMKQDPMDTSWIKEEPLTAPSSFETTIKVKEEVESEDEIPLSVRLSAVEKEKKKRKLEESDDDIPLMERKKMKKEKDNAEKKKKRKMMDDEDEKPAKKATKKVNKIKSEPTSQDSPKKGKKKEDTSEVWRWWEEEKRDDGVKWHYLEHKGPVFAPPYERLPSSVKFHYDGKEMQLSELAEEVATFYARMLDHDYTSKPAFNTNFFKDWRKCMTQKEQETITDLSKCNFKHMHAYFLEKSEERKNMTKEEKKAIKEKNDEIMEEYGYCTIDGHKERIGNFKIEPPGLFRGRGEHPKMGMLKRRVMPEDVIINCSKDSDIPKPPEGHRWKEVRHDTSVTWLASWTENVQGQNKYVMLNPSSKLKGEKDWQKYETARKLAKSIDKIRAEYREDWKSKEMRIRQRAVALYFIDKLALRAGNEKDEDQADTVGCCSLRVEHIQLHEEKDGKQFVVVFDFLGKDSIRYYNEVPVEKRVFKNVQLFMENKQPGDDLFDRLNTGILNKHLNELMEGLTAKVFRTFNASFTLQAQLNELTDPDASIPEKILQYNRANRAVAILCNHQRSVPKTHAKSMENLMNKIEQKKDQVKEAEKQYKDAKKYARGSQKESMVAEKKKKALERLRDQLAKLEVQATDKDENKEIALGTSKLNYLDPRISVAWCKKHEVPIEKIYNKTQREKFRWAIDMAGPEYVF
ncbi:DNA topoisomerase I, mitochondrial isoform X2 [Ischnura elegans]|uniref:DNA topoisomerase I, mitochondrial isoform X2 n=1 Tax=Ischnura elegans TaxID=197161 RepID=UPI001ED87A11|nr:DNA topoisomerase I, mitochondrial isoform X2 [Ischnura elegans]